MPIFHSLFLAHHISLTASNLCESALGLLGEILRWITEMVLLHHCGGAIVAGRIAPHIGENGSDIRSLRPRLVRGRRSTPLRRIILRFVRWPHHHRRLPI